MKRMKMAKWLIAVGLLQCGVIAQTHTIPINIKGMAPHLGQLMKARLVETATGIQKAETTITSIGSENFQLLFQGESGIAYDLDLFVDTDGNKAYSVPPLDHAWRQAIPVVHHGDATVTFNHDANFTDIKYPSPGVSIRPVRSPGRNAAWRGARMLTTPSSYASDPDFDGFTLLGSRASAGSHKVLLLIGTPDKDR